MLEINKGKKLNLTFSIKVSDKFDHYKCLAFCVPLDYKGRIVLNFELS